MLKAHAHLSIFVGSVLESAPESAKSSTALADSSTVRDSQQTVYNMFDIYMPIQTADRNRLTIVVSRRHIGQVGMALFI